MKSLKNGGDTIIEVLIALTVISLVLGGAYVSANHSLNNSRQAQERGEALKLAEGQVEKLKQLANSGNTTVFTTPNIFCIDLNNSQSVQDATSPTRNTLPQPASSDDLNSYKPNVCGKLGLGQLYNTATERNSTNQFTVYVRWDRAGSNGRDELKIVTRVYK